MANLVDIANYALAEVGEAELTTIDDATRPARLVRRFIYPSIQEVLRMGLWKCARKSAALGQLSEAPAFGWAYQYELPVDFLRIVSFNDIDPDDVQEELFEIRGRRLQTDETTAKIVYVCDLTNAVNDIGAADALLVRCFVLQLAVKLAWPLQATRTHKESLEQSLEIALRKAKAADSREEFRPLPNLRASSRWIGSRYNSTNG